MTQILDPSLRLSPTNDFVFKAILTSSEDVLISLLTAVLKPPVPIRRAIVKNPELPKSFEDEKGGFLDIAVTLDDGTQLDVEMQASRQGKFQPRGLFYWARLFSSQLSQGEDHSRLSRTVSVIFLDYREFLFRQFHEVFHIRGEQTGTIFSPLLEIHTIELPKLTQALAKTTAPSDRAFVRWCRYLASKDSQELQQLIEEDPMLEKAEEKLSTVSTDPQLREIALERERREIAHRLTLTSAWDEGHEQGVAEGKAEGERLLLEKLLKRKFGPLPEETRQRLDDAGEDELTLWAERILTADTLDEIFS